MTRTTLTTDALLGELAQLDSGCSGRIAVSALHRGTGELVEWRSHETLRTASSAKVALHVVVMTRVAAGALDLATRVPLTREELVGGSGVLCVLQPGLTPTIGDLCTLMIVVSDNTATNILLDLVGGVEVINGVMRTLGLGGIRFHRRLDYPPPPLIIADPRLFVTPTIPFATATASALSRLLVQLHEGTLLDRESSRRVLDVLAAQYSPDGVARDFSDVTTRWQPRVDVPSLAHKPGTIPGARCDVGLIGLPHGDDIVYAAMADDLSDLTMTSGSEGDLLLGRIGRLLLRRWWPVELTIPLRTR